MPTISEFYGLKIIMRFKEKHGPHFHVEYAGDEALISIRNGQVLGGKLPGRAHRLALEWLALHRDELMENWENARRHKELKPIDGLE